MKKTILSLVVLCFTMATQAQPGEPTGATLQVGDEVTMFYGSGALKAALDAAPQSGGVITLTAGLFDWNANWKITKSVSIYGAGWEDDNVSSTYLSRFGSSGNNWGNIVIEGTSEQPLENVTIEGIRMWSYATPLQISYAKNVTISRSWLGGLQINGQSENITIRQCYFDSDTSIQSSAQVVGLTIQNCLIYRVSNINTTSSVLIDHCILNPNNNGYQHSGTPIYTNNIVTGTSPFVNGTVAKYNLFLNATSLDATIDAEGSWLKNDVITPLFSDTNDNSVSYSSTRTFELTAEAKAKFIGSDGTEVGPHGGSFPWTKIPSTPRLKDIELGVSGTTLNVTYDAETR